MVQLNVVVYVAVVVMFLLLSVSLSYM